MPPSLEAATPVELLSLAAGLARTDLVVEALRAGADVDALCDGKTALRTAVSTGAEDAVRALLQAGATVCAADLEVASPGILAVFDADLCMKAGRGEVDAVRAAVREGVNVNGLDSAEAGNGPLHWAAGFGCLEVCRVLLQCGATVNMINAAGVTPLMDAASAGHTDVVRLLVKKGAEVGLLSNSGKTALDLATDPVKHVLHSVGNADAAAADDGRGVANGNPAVKAPVANTAAVQVSPERVESHPPLPTTPTTPYFAPGERMGHQGPHSPGEAVLPEWARTLWPRPQRMFFADKHDASSFAVPPRIVISSEQGCMDVAAMLSIWLRENFALPASEYSVQVVGGGVGGIGEPQGFAAAIVLRVDSLAIERPEQAYRLTVRKDTGICVVGSDVAGLFYGCATLRDVFRASQQRDVAGRSGVALTIPACSITDWPSLRRRGLFLDISSHRLPKMETLEALISMVAVRFKINQLQLDIGSNFARLGATNPSSHCLTHEDILRLDRICRQYFVELVPVVSRTVARNQQDKLFEEYLPLFSCAQVNVGNFGVGSRECSSEDFEALRRAARSSRGRGKPTVLFFDQGLMPLLCDSTKTSNTLAELPARSVVLLEASRLPGDSFHKQSLLLAQCGVPFYACISTCAEFSIAGRLSRCLGLMQNALQQASAHGGSGALLTDRSLDSEGAPLAILYQSILPFAGGAWNVQRCVQAGPKGPEKLLSQLLDVHVFMDTVEHGVLGNIAVVLGDLHIVTGDTDGSVIQSLLSHQSGEQFSIDSLGYIGLRRAMKRAERAEIALSSYKGNAVPVDVTELRLCSVLLSAAARVGALLLSVSSAASMKAGKDGSRAKPTLSSLPDGRRSDLCNELLKAIELLRDSWVQRFHSDGFVQTVELTLGESLASLAEGMPYAHFLEDRKYNKWAPV